MPEDKAKSRTRVVSLRIPDHIYEDICFEADRRTIPPSKLLTHIVSKAVADWTLERQ